MATLANLILSCRILVHDSPDDKTVFSEQLGGSDQLAFPVDGSNKTFRLKNAPMADANTAMSADALYTWVTIIGTGAVVRSQLHTLFTVTDRVNGIIAFVAAPNPGTTVPNAGIYV